MSNFGVVQSSAATVIGLQSPEMVQIQIQMLKNANEQREDTFAIGAMVTDDKNAATVELGHQQAMETRINAEAQVSGAVASTIVMGGTGVKSAFIDQPKVDLMNKQLTNIGTFKGSLVGESPEGIGFKNPAVQDLDGPPLNTLAKPETPFKDGFNNAKNLDEKAKLFDNQPEGYFENAAKEFSGDAPKGEKSPRARALSDATELEEYLQRQVSVLNGKIDNNTRMGQAFGQSLNGLVSGSLEMRAAETKAAQAQQQVLQNEADNSKSFVETMQSTMDQMVQMSLKGIEELNQNLQSVVQASNSRA